MKYIFSIFIFVLVYVIKSDILNPHALPLSDEEDILTRDIAIPKRQFIPRLISGVSQRQNYDQDNLKKLIVYYSFDKQKSGEARIKDESGYDNNGVVEVGGVLLLMPGSTCNVAAYLWAQAIKISFNTPDGCPKYGISISMWMRMLDISKERVVFHARGHRFGIMCIKFVENIAHFYYRYSNNGSIIFYLAAETSITNEWFHLAATYNATTGIAQLYINGVPLNRTWNKFAHPFQYFGNDVIIGASSPRPSIKGYVDDVRIHNYALTSSDVQMLSISCCFNNCPKGPDDYPNDNQNVNSDSDSRIQPNEDQNLVPGGYTGGNSIADQNLNPNENSIVPLKLPFENVGYTYPYKKNTIPVSIPLT